jgi:ribose/xylose/arabinose/galactoside ABC-type transport system permease subunit
MSKETTNTASLPVVTAKKFDLGHFARTYMIVGVLILFVGALAIMTHGNSIDPRNLVNVIRQVSAIGIIGVGMTFVIITLGIDLSVGSILGLSAVVAASLAQVPGGSLVKFQGVDVPVIVAVIAGLAVGALAGFTNGVLIAKFRLAPFIATLGMMSIARGLAYIYTGDGRPFSGLKPEFNNLGQGYLIPNAKVPENGLFPLPVVLFLAVAIIATLVLSYTKFGRYTYAIGGNEVAARVSGIRIPRVTIIIYTISGVLAALAGILWAARIGSGNSTLGQGIELDAITAVIVGGTSFKGGIGKIWGTVVGALLIGTINNGLDLLNVSPFLQIVVKGCIIIVAIIIDERKNSKKA